MGGQAMMFPMQQGTMMQILGQGMLAMPGAMPNMPGYGMSNFGNYGMNQGFNMGNNMGKKW